MNNQLCQKAPDFTRAPQSGWVLAVLENEVLLEAYIRDGNQIRFPGYEKMTESALRRCHCFDKNTEYRWMRIGNRGRVVEKVFTAEEEEGMDPDLLFEDKMIISEAYLPSEQGICAIRVMNRYRYTPSDTLTLDNYRLAGIE